MSTTHVSEVLRLPVNRAMLVSALAAGFGALFLLSLGQDVLAWAGVGVRRTVMFDVDVEGGAFAWASSLMLALNALILFALWGTARADRWAWFALAAGFLALSMDEMVGVHERVGGLLGQVMPMRGAFYFVWVVPGLAIVACLASLFAPFLLRLPQPTGRLFLAAGALYVGGAIGVEMIGAAVAETRGMADAGYRLLVHVEEGLEIAGQLLFFWALLGCAASRNGEWRLALEQRAAP